MKEWDTIMRSIPSPENSDTEDSVNIMSLQKNAPRVIQLMQHTLPGLSNDVTSSMPMGINRTDIIRDGISSTVHAVEKEESTTMATAQSE